MSIYGKFLIRKINILNLVRYREDYILRLIKGFNRDTFNGNN